MQDTHSIGSWPLPTAQHYTAPPHPFFHCKIHKLGHTFFTSDDTYRMCTVQCV